MLAAKGYSTGSSVAANLVSAGYSIAQIKEMLGSFIIVTHITNSLNTTTSVGYANNLMTTIK